MATDIDGTTFSETDASNNTASPNGWPEGMAPSGVNDSARMVMGAIKRAFDRDHAGAWCTVGGTATSITLTYASGPSAYLQGQAFAFKATSRCAGASQLNVSTLGAKDLKKRTPSGLASCAGGEWASGDLVIGEYDGTQFQLLNGPALPPAPLKSGLSVSVGATTNETVLATLSIGPLGPNGLVRGRVPWACNSNANNKNVRVRIGTVTGAAIAGPFTLASLTGSIFEFTMRAANTTNAQVTESSNLLTSGNVNVATNTTSTANLTTAQTLVITGEKGNAGDTMTMLGYDVVTIDDGA